MTTIIIEQMYDSDFSVKLRADDAEMFRLGIDTLKSFITSTSRSYDPHEKRWIIAGLAEYSLIRWLDYCTGNLHANIEWLNGDPRQRQRQESSWTPPPPRRHQTRDDALRVLHLLPTAPASVIRASYKALSLEFHPDKPGGDTRKMQQLNAAFEVLSKQMAT